MRDLGLMGESTFSLWCADVGLIPNGSQIDKTGWDFFVEFPFSSGISTHEIHKSAFECKVQVKATDRNQRKLPITLSNLRRLITAQMPAFFVFIEFDGKEVAQRAFVVHVDDNLISKVLKRLHQVDQSERDNNFNKRKMTISYDESHAIELLNGAGLKERFLSYIGGSIEDYIATKKSHLESTGYENGFAQVTFTTDGEENLKTLIDVSLGIEEQVEISSFKGVDTRFGIKSRSPFVDSEGGRLEMPNVKPKADGKIRFKENKLSPGLSFIAKLYNSPFNAMVPNALKKMRVEGEFFDLTFNPYTGSASYSFSIGEGIRLEVKKFRDAIKLLNLLGSSGKKLFAEFLFESLPKLELQVGCSGQEFDFSDELQSLECAVSILSDFEVNDIVDISLEEISRHGSQICQMHSISGAAPSVFKVEFDVDGDGYDPLKPTACIFLVTTPIGSHVIGAILVLTGTVEGIENGRFRLISEDVVIEQKIVSEKDSAISNEDLVSAVEKIEVKYESDFSVVTMFHKSANE
ncbi:hypothetical protein ACTXKF_18865 [Vreelandella alkaliphila]|uniref:DUF4365 domain-containing protein n=3 Tax=Oceanospirillales TaxID=135619 RepID=UPI001869098C|nr:DUF4365 domain-containing protein [Halomonas sp. FME65]